MVTIKTNQRPLLLELDQSKELRQKSPLDINGLLLDNEVVQKPPQKTSHV